MKTITQKNKSMQQTQNHEHDAGCSCGHDHSHEPAKHSHSHEENHEAGCACGHSHEISFDTGCSCGHNHGTPQKNQKVPPLFFPILSAVFMVAGFFFHDSIVGNILFSVSILLAGYPMFWAGIKSILRFRLDETALLLIAVVAAAALGEFAEGAMVTVLFRLGNMLEDLAISRSKKNISSLTKIRPETANVLVDGSFSVQSAASVPVGSEILIKPGERVPLDAVIVSGESNLDTAVLTGESIPRTASAGDTVLSGMINQDGALRCQTINSFSDSAASRIITLVQESAAKKGNTEKMITKFSRVYTPFIIVSALLLTFLPPLLGFGSIQTWLGRALVFLVASCPCALVISVPLAFFAGVGAGSKQGILIKGSKALENLAKVKNAVFDKTGTLTTGKLAVTDIVPLDSSLAASELLALAAIGESFSNHPMALAVIEKHGPVDTSSVSSYKEHPGMGVSYEMNGASYLCGGEKLLQSFSVGTKDLPFGNIYLAQNGVVLGYLLVEDTLRPDAKQTLLDLKAAGVEKTVMLTGDNAATAKQMQAQSGVDLFYAQLLPEEKVSHLEEIKKSGITLFVGDGMNDAPVLAMADIGVAMGLGTDAAIEAADVVLVSDRLSDLTKAAALAKRTVSVAWFNIIFALGIKAIVLALGAFGLAAMWMAVFADVGVSILAVLNATRILKSKK